MKKIYVLILKSYIGPLVMTFFITLFIIVMQFLWRYVDDLVGKGLEWYLIAELLFYASATFVPLALPLAILLASLMTFGNMGEHYELVSMKAAGISLQKAMKPLVILSILISLLAFYFSNNILPIANLKFHSLYYDIREKKLAFNIKEGIFYNDLDNYVIRIGKKENDDIHIRDVMIYNHSDQLGNIQVTIAKTGKMETTPDGRYMIFTLYDGYNYKEKIDEQGHRNTRPFERSSFDEENIKFDLGNFQMNHLDEDLFRKHYMMLDIKQLNFSIDSLSLIKNARTEEFAIGRKNNFRFYNKIDSGAFALNEPNSINTGLDLSTMSPDTKRDLLERSLNSTLGITNTINYEVDELKRQQEYITRFIITIYEKFTLSFACLILFFIGAPLGAIIRKGGLGLPVVVSVIFFIILHISTIMSKKYILAGVLSPEVGMWIASAVLLPIGIFLTYKATADAPLLDADAWRKVIRSGINFFSKADKTSA
ncbi:MAG: LptF/LptG family permease [Bacteroidetes bacterium]|nr:LptF/LptG family permease [Bacteroidota bacterium]